MQPRQPTSPHADARRDVRDGVGTDADFGVDEDEPTDVAPRAFRARVLVVLWPAFMMAALLEALVFSVVDPSSLLAWAAVAVYSVSFLLFWVAIAAASAITLWLDSPGPWRAN
jgi:hypothetical protein